MIYSASLFVLPKRIRAKIKIDGQTKCWLWIAGLFVDGGYGQVRDLNGVRGKRAHHVIYEALVGTIPPGMQLDHLCRVRHCVNPNHLEPVTPRENCRRSPIIGDVRIGDVNRGKTHCANGHLFDEENTKHYYVKGVFRTRKCRACEQARNKNQ